MKNSTISAFEILEAVYLWGLQAAICILVYVKDGKPKPVSAAADTAGTLAAARGSQFGG